VSTKPVTHQIYDEIFKILQENKEGVSWTDLNKKVEASNPNFHPKTVNGCVWKLVEKYPDKVYKTNDKLFRLIKYKS
jgi:Mg2+/Co2+ transporter CorB